MSAPIDPALWWLDELIFDALASGPKMGVRALGGQPWLIEDSDRPVDLARRSVLLAERHGEVAVLSAASEAPAEVVVELIEAAALSVSRSPDRHPLECAARAVQEDLCLMHRDGGEWLLDSAVLCFPSRWRLADKAGKPMHAIHQPVGGYDPAFSNKVDRFIDRLSVAPVRRRNWFVHPDNDLFQPTKNLAGDPIVAAANCRTNLFVRSERQTLRRIAQDWILFTIRIQRCPLGQLLDRRPEFSAYITDVDQQQLAHHGIKPAQRQQILDNLSR